MHSARWRRGAGSIDIDMWQCYICDSHMKKQEWKKGSAELLVLSLVEDQPRHGYDISKLIDVRSGGELKFHVASLYPLLYRMEKRELVEGRWVEKAGQRRRRYYRITPLGRKILAQQRKGWKAFVAGVCEIAGIEHA